MANLKTKNIIPVLLAFFVMGFVDIIGISTNYIKQDFSLTDTAANAFSVMLFVWFLILSVPTGLLMNKIGRKRTVLLSMVITLFSLICPLVFYSKAGMFLAVALIGIGNTLLQVSLNPLVANMVSQEKQASILTLGQFIKAIASFSAPILAVQAAVHFGDWKLLFALFAIIDLIAVIYLYCTEVTETEEKKESSSFVGSMKLLGNLSIFLLFVGILMHVGIDVGINITAPKILQERAGLSLDAAAYATSIYFLLRTASCFLGTFIMSRFSPGKFFMFSVLMMLAGVAGLFCFSNTLAIYICVGLIGFGNANIFSVIFAAALKAMPQKNNEISGLMIMGVSGGGIVPIIMGAASDGMGSQNGALIVIGICMLYLAFLGLKMNKTNNA